MSNGGSQFNLNFLFNFNHRRHRESLQASCRLPHSAGGASRTCSGYCTQQASSGHCTRQSGPGGRAVDTALSSRGQEDVQWILHSAVGASRTCSWHCTQLSGPAGRAVGTALSMLTFLN